MTISRQASGATINLRWNKRSLWKHLTSVTKNADNFTTQISLRGISKNIFSDLEKRLINNIWTHLVIYGLKYGLENISRPIMGGVVAWVEWETWSDLSVLSGELHGHRRPSVSPSATNVFYYDIALKSQIIPVKGRSFPSEIWMRAVSLSLFLSLAQPCFYFIPWRCAVSPTFPIAFRRFLKCVSLMIEFFSFSWKSFL